jgi:fructose-1,6-bisphosphatase/inositol monophosphatase family enzyme
VLSAGDSQRVAELMRETAAAELLPRFRNLATGDIRQKRPGDFVTVADLASEQRLAAGLAKILPGVAVIGEEAVEADPGLLDLLQRRGASCWIVDPLDGTANFAAGRDRFAMIVALVEDGRTIGGWILDVPGDRLAAAQLGQGVTLEGAVVRGMPPKGKLNGLVGYKVRREFDRHLPRALRQRLGWLETFGCAGHEYLSILSGRADFCLYRMTKPWDHAAGALMLSEAGGAARRFDGQPYSPVQKLDAGIIAAATRQALAEVGELFDAVKMPLLAPART